jgi:hypothetical protein
MEHVWMRIWLSNNQLDVCAVKAGLDLIAAIFLMDLTSQRPKNVQQRLSNSLLAGPLRKFKLCEGFDGYGNQ